MSFNAIRENEILANISEFTVFLLSAKSLWIRPPDKSHHIIGFLINVQVQGHHPHQWAPFQVTG